MTDRERHGELAGDPGPVVFVLFGATGDLARRMVLPTFYQLAREPPLPRQWRLVGNGRGDVTDESFRERVISCFRPLDPAEVVLGQFDGYREVPGVNPASRQDTFVAARLWIDNSPLARRAVPPAHRQADGRLPSAGQPDPPRSARPAVRSAAPGANVLSFSLAGDGGIDLSLMAKKPGPALELDVAHASIPLASLHGADPLPPYVRLIHDVLLGDRSLFTRPDGLAAVWDVAEPLLSTPPAVSTYPPGSWGQPKHVTSSHQGAGFSASSRPGTR